MKTLIAYYSRAGATKKAAEALHTASFPKRFVRVDLEVMYFIN